METRYKVFKYPIPFLMLFGKDGERRAYYAFCHQVSLPLTSRFDYAVVCKSTAGRCGWPLARPLVDPRGGDPLLIFLCSVDHSGGQCREA